MGKPKFSSAIGEKSLGFNELEEFLNTTWNENRSYVSYIRKPKSMYDLAFFWENLKDNNMYIFDGDIDWFAKIWYLNRFFYYHNIYIASDSEISSFVGLDKDLFAEFRKAGVRYVYYIKAANDSVYSSAYLSNEEQKKYSSLLEKNFLYNIETLHHGEKFLISNDYGELAFKVYKLRLN